VSAGYNAAFLTLAFVAALALIAFAAFMPETGRWRTVALIPAHAQA
jgi:hypothetical protein